MSSFINDNNRLHNPNVFASILTTQIGVDTFAPLRTFRSVSVTCQAHDCQDTDGRNRRFIF